VVVVAGASFAGISAALALREGAPGAEVVLVEPAPVFVFAPGALAYLFGLAPFEGIARRYAALEARGLRVVRASVLAVERDRRRVVTTAGSLPYDYLLIATGLRVAPEEVPGLGEALPGLNLHPYEPGSSLLELRRRILGFRGGHVVVSTPASPYKCPPAPYEYALLWAEHLRRRGLPGHVTLVESRSRPLAPLAPGLLRAIEAHKGVLTYEPFTRVLSVDPGARRVETEAGRLTFDFLSLIPPHRVVPFVAEADVGAGLVDVDPLTFRSVKDERIYAVGDTADSPYARTAHTAVTAGRLAGRQIARALGARVEDLRAPQNVCFPMVARDRALRLGQDWYFERDEAGAVQVKVAGTADNDAKAGNLRLRQAWQARLLEELFGPSGA
jgi:NADPH-dependent 2,4-dienoyl-CoA reductase/sulfur reductase-like enzyme